MKSKDEVQEEALRAVLPLKRAGVGISMGVGKTLIGLRHAESNYNDFARYLVVAPKKSIFKSWKDESILWKMRYLIPHFKFCTYRSLTKENPEDYDIIYLDECHSLLPSHEAWLDKFQGTILGLSGTPPKFEKSTRGKLVSKFCPIVYKYITDEAVNDKILNNYKIIVQTLPLDKAKTLRVEKGGKVWYTSEQATYDYWTNRIGSSMTQKDEQITRVMRMKSLMGFPSKDVLAAKLLAGTTNKTILFVNTQEQADRLCPYSYHSGNPDSEENLEKFKSGDITKLSCVLQLSEGINIPNLKVGIITHAYGNERKTSQRIGRLLRLNPKETAVIHILCYTDTVDEQWVVKALSDFDQSKITWIS